MALSGVLSALRQLILDDLEIPAAYQQRFDFYQQSFKTLDIAEIEDLAKIEPAKFEIYTGTIFAGERSVLGNHFPLSFAIIGAAWEQAHGESFNRVEFIKELHRSKPWKSSTTKQLAMNFHQYVNDELGAILEISPELSDASHLELLILGIARQKEKELRGVALYDPEDFPQWTVAELMDLSFRIPRCLRFVRFDYDVVSLRRTYFEEKELSPATKFESARCMVGSRNKFGSVRWLALGEDVFDYLSQLSPTEDCSLQDLAMEIIGSAAPGLSEEEQFGLFYRSFVELLQVGALVIAKPVAEN